MRDEQPPSGARRGAAEFAAEAVESRPGLVAELWEFLAANKKWWLMPIVAVLLLVGALLLMSGTVAAPFIYTLF